MDQNYMQINKLLKKNVVNLERHRIKVNELNDENEIK